MTDSRPDQDGRFVGQVIAVETTCPDWDANARLIASSPDMLAALNYVAGVLQTEAGSNRLLLEAQGIVDRAMRLAGIEAEESPR